MDWDGFEAWLTRNGAKAELVASYRKGAERIVLSAGGAPVRPVHVDQALQRAEDKGASGKELANLRKIGDICLRYLKETAAAAPTPVSGATAAAPALPSPSARPPAALASARPAVEARPSPKTGGTARVVLSVASALVGMYFGRGCVDGLLTRTEPVGAGFQSAHLGLGIDFPDGWKHVKGDDESKTENGISIKSSTFFRGGTAKKPHRGLAMGVFALTGPLQGAAAARDEQLLAIGRNGLEGAAKGMLKDGGTVEKGGCVIASAAGERAVRCTAVGSEGGTTYDMTIDFAFGDLRGAMILFAAKRGKGDAADERAAILGSIHL